MSNEPAYDQAPDITDEMTWLLAQVRQMRNGLVLTRGFQVRKAALLDRIALHEEAHYPDSSADAVAAADATARALVDYDVEFRGLSLRAAELVTDADCRAYVREVYAAWSRSQLV